MTDQPSGRLYSTVTQYWPRIATGLVLLIGVIEFVVGGLTADSGLEFYLFAWAGLTGGVWFLFETSEKTLTEEVRTTVSRWIRATDRGAAVSSIPAQFAALFDRLFGEQHLTKECFQRSANASMASICLVYVLLSAAGVPGIPSPRVALTFLAFGVVIESYDRVLKPRLDLGLKSLTVFTTAIGSVATFTILRAAEADIEATMAGMAAVFTSYFVLLAYNIVPDYLSLLQTRWALGIMTRKSLVLPVILGDFLVTWSIWAVAAVIVGVAAVWIPAMPSGVWLLWPPALIEWLFLSDDPIRGAYQMSFFTTFLTSAWLWLYAASVLISRVLLRMNSGVGFLLRVTDVERQPFRSMGFVSVIIVSCLFALGLPLVLL